MSMTAGNWKQPTPCQGTHQESIVTWYLLESVTALNMVINAYSRDHHSDGCDGSDKARCRGLRYGQLLSQGLTVKASTWKRPSWTSHYVTSSRRSFQSINEVVLCLIRLVRPHWYSERWGCVVLGLVGSRTTALTLFRRIENLKLQGYFHFPKSDLKSTS